MSCREQNRVFDYLLGELPEADRKHVEVHVEQCDACRSLSEEFGMTDRALRARKTSPIPEGLASSCARFIDDRTRTASEPRRLRLDDSWIRRLLVPSPAWRFAVLVVVFLGGMGAGKLLFDSPSWMERIGRLIPSEASQEISEGRSIRNYLLSVETLFLGLSNMESAGLLDEEDWEMELEVTREVLKRTRRMKRILEERNPELHQLVGEIEWVLEDIVGSSGWEFVEVSRDVRREIDERRLLMKIHVHI